MLAAGVPLLIEVARRMRLNTDKMLFSQLGNHCHDSRGTPEASSSHLPWLGVLWHLLALLESGMAHRESSDLYARRMLSTGPGMGLTHSFSQTDHLNNVFMTHWVS